MQSTQKDSKAINIKDQDMKFLKNLAHRIINSGLITPAVFFLEIIKPMSLLGSHALIFLGPILNSFIQSEDYYRKVEVFEKPENIEILLQMIEKIDEYER